MINLTNRQILDFYDVPQLFVAVDAMNTNYLCLLYNYDNAYEYLAVKVSELRLKRFLSGDLDLRKAYTDPEQDDSLYHVVVKESKTFADRMLQSSDLNDEMLPDSGYYYDTEDAVDFPLTESIQMEIPSKDYNFLETIVHRMGWIANQLGSSSRKVAVL